jgi:hypothetical protein
MAALRLPTSRALALVGIPSVKVRRETIETAAIVTRVADSWIRIGVSDAVFSFFPTTSEGKVIFQTELRDSKDPRRVGEPAHADTLRRPSSLLIQRCNESSFRHAERTRTGTERAKGSRATECRDDRWLASLRVRRIPSRDPCVVADSFNSFMHGVMNTDNIAVTGACIDYGCVDTLSSLLDEGLTPSALQTVCLDVRRFGLFRPAPRSIFALMQGHFRPDAHLQPLGRRWSIQLRECRSSVLPHPSPNQCLYSATNRRWVSSPSRNWGLLSPSLSAAKPTSLKARKVPPGQASSRSTSCGEKVVRRRDGWKDGAKSGWTSLRRSKETLSKPSPRSTRD